MHVWLARRDLARASAQLELMDWLLCGTSRYDWHFISLECVMWWCDYWWSHWAGGKHLHMWHVRHVHSSLGVGNGTWLRGDSTNLYCCYTQCTSMKYRAHHSLHWVLLCNLQDSTSAPEWSEPGCYSEFLAYVVIMQLWCVCVCVRVRARVCVCVRACVCVCTHCE